jgi:hypothetical protein
MLKYTKLCWAYNVNRNLKLIVTTNDNLNNIKVYNCEKYYLFINKILPMKKNINERDELWDFLINKKISYFNEKGDLEIDNEIKVKKKSLWNEIDSEIRISLFRNNNLFNGLLGKEVGFTIDKELPIKYDIVTLNVLPGCISTMVVKPIVKNIIENEKLSGVNFCPIWIKKYDEKKEPDYYLMYSPYAPDFETYDINWRDFKNPKNPDGSFDSLYNKKINQDFDTDMIQSAGPQRMYIHPSVLNQKAFEVLQNFKGLYFKDTKYQD